METDWRDVTIGKGMPTATRAEMSYSKGSAWTVALLITLISAQ